MFNNEIFNLYNLKTKENSNHLMLYNTKLWNNWLQKLDIYIMSAPYFYVYIYTCIYLHWYICIPSYIAIYFLCVCTLSIFHWQPWSLIQGLLHYRNNYFLFLLKKGWCLGMNIDRKKEKYVNNKLSINYTTEWTTSITWSRTSLPHRTSRVENSLN